MAEKSVEKDTANLPHIARHWAIIFLYPMLLILVFTGRHHAIVLFFMAMPFWTDFGRRKLFGLNEFFSVQGASPRAKWRVLITIGFCVFITYRSIVVALENAAGA